MDGQIHDMTPERAATLNSDRYAAIPAEDRAETLRRDVMLVLSARIEALAKIDQDAVIDALSFALADMAQRSPDVSLHADMARRDAELWARMATPDEIEAYGTACLRNVPDKVLHPGLLKRVLTNVWRRLDVTDRRRFLERVAAENKQGSNRA